MELEKWFLLILFTNTDGHGDDYKAQHIHEENSIELKWLEST